MWKKIKTDGETRNDGDFKQLEREVRLSNNNYFISFTAKCTK